MGPLLVVNTNPNPVGVQISIYVISIYLISFTIFFFFFLILHNIQLVFLFFSIRYFSITLDRKTMGPLLVVNTNPNPVGVQISIYVISIYVISLPPPFFLLFFLLLKSFITYNFFFLSFLLGTFPSRWTVRRWAPSWWLILTLTL